MPNVTGYEVDANRVFTGNERVFKPKEPIPRNFIVIEPPKTEGFHIFDGVKWFTREEYPTIPNKTQAKRISGRDVFDKLTLQEKLALEEASDAHSSVRVVKDEFFKSDKTYEEDSEDLNFMIDILVDKEVFTKERMDELL